MAPRRSALGARGFLVVGARVLLVGLGGREHAIAWKLAQSPLVAEIFIAPGNGGTAEVGTNVPVQPKDIDGLCSAAGDLGIDFYLASMDDPQPLGLVDRLTARGVQCYGPTQSAAQLEASKVFSKRFMLEAGIRTAEAESFSDPDAAVRYVSSIPEQTLWVKADGLAAGKGAIGCRSRAEAFAAIDQVMVRREFGASGSAVVIEQDLRGWETSTHAFCDGKTARMMPFATDHKRVGDGDTGLNTGGMGACSPSVRVDGELAARIEGDVVDRVLAGMAKRGTPYAGTLFPGVMVTESGVFVLEFNARFGDPETQVLMPRLESDLFSVCSAAAEGRLAEEEIRWSPRAAVGVVLASGGYPGSYETGKPISGLQSLDSGVLAFHAGTRREGDRLLTNGGRVLTIVATGDSVAEARERAYDNVGRVSFEGMQYRRDIAAAG
jgi:phosphoribosylamine--glycine ligase